MTSTIEVFYKKNYGDKKKDSIKNRLASVGLMSVLEVIPSTLFQIEGDYSEDEIQAIATRVLTDPILQEFNVSNKKNPGFYKVKVFIRDSSTDVIGDSVKDAIFVASFKRPHEVRVGNSFSIKGSFSLKDLEDAIKKTFVNENLNKFSIEKE